MANPEVDRLIQLLSQILNSNREKRASAESMAKGFEQGQAQSSGAAAGQAAGQAQSSAAGQSRDVAKRYAEAQSNQRSPHAFGDPSKRDETGYLKHNNKSFRDAPTQLEDNAAPYEFLSEREQPAQPLTGADAAILEERKKRMTQNMMLSRGQSGGPMGGAGMPAQDPNAGLDPAVVEAVSRSGGPVQQMPLQMQQRPDPMTAPNPYVSQGAPPAGWSDADFAKLNALSQRYPG